MDYKKIYNDLINRRIQSPTSSGEKHHIIPKCLGGSDAKDNLILLTAREHYIAHLLLCKMYPTNASLWYASNMMSVSSRYSDRDRITGAMYEVVKTKIKNLSSQRMNNVMFIKNIETGIIVHHNKYKKIPEGWVKENNKPTQGKVRYYNITTDTEIMLDKDQTVPNGFVKGRRPHKLLFNKDGSGVMWNKGPYDKSVWSEYPITYEKYFCLQTGDVIHITFNDSIPLGYQKSELTTDRNLVCTHLHTMNSAVLTKKEYEDNVYWVRANKAWTTTLYSTDIGVVRNKNEYYRKTGISLNLSRYCRSNELIVTGWLIARSNLPSSWLGKTWIELGFFIVEV